MACPVHADVVVYVGMCCYCRYACMSRYTVHTFLATAHPSSPQRSHSMSQGDPATGDHGSLLSPPPWTALSMFRRPPSSLLLPEHIRPVSRDRPCNQRPTYIWSVI
jgi:hypothetical protein